MRAQGRQTPYPTRGPAVDARVDSWLVDAIRGTRQDDLDLEVLLDDLDSVRRATDRAYWRRHVVPRLRRHPVYERVMACPFSRYAAARPRGYAGDALMMDFLYQRETVRPLVLAATPWGRLLSSFFAHSPLGHAVRARRAWLAGRLDAIAAERPHPRVLAVGCGHVPELDLSEAAAADGFARFVALDRDPQTLAHVEATGAVDPAGLVQAPVRSLLRAPAPDEVYDVVYAVGLYDHLDDELARRLTENLVARLAPGGELILDNFLPSNPNIAAMEVFQDWWLTYRSPRELRQLLDEVDGARIAQIELRTDPEDCLGVLTAQAT